MSGRALGFWLASIAGAAIVVVFMVRQSGANTIQLGDIYLLGTVLSGAFGYTLSGRLSRNAPGLGSDLVAGCVVPSAVSDRSHRALAAGARPACRASAWAGLAYVSFVSQFFAFFVFNAAMAMGGVARVGQLMLLQPFVIVALSVPVNGERFDIVDAAVCRGGRRGGASLASAWV